MTSYKASIPPNMAQMNAQKLQIDMRDGDSRIHDIETSNTDRHPAFSNQFNRNRSAMADYTNDSMMFSIDTPINDRRMQNKYDRLKQVSAATSNTLKEVSNEYTDPETGRKIINAEYNNIWFSQHVYMLFSLGRIFDRDDQQFFASVNNYFNQENEMYLSCNHDTMNYKDDLIKKIEKQIGIDNGNYHLLLVLIVYADEDELEHPPEFLFSTSGIVKWAIESDEIKEIMLTFLSRYGIATEDIVPHKIPARISGRRDDNTLLDNKFKLHDEIDWNSEPNRMLFSDLSYRNNRDEDFAVRMRVNEDPRISGKRERHTRNRTEGGTLYQRMHEDSLKASTVPQYSKQVVISKMVENTIPSDYIGAEPYNVDTGIEKSDRDRVRNFQIYEDRNKVQSKVLGKPNIMSVDYSMLYDYGVDSNMDIKVTGVKRTPGRTVTYHG